MAHNDLKLIPQHRMVEGAFYRYVYAVVRGDRVYGHVSGPEPHGPWQVISPGGHYLGTVEHMPEALHKLNAA